MNIDELKAKFPKATFRSNISNTRVQPDTLEDTRHKVAEKAKLSLNYLKDPSSHTRPDRVYKEYRQGEYAVGLKYGNRWVPKLFGDSTFMAGLTKSDLEEALSTLMACAVNGDFDTQIKSVRDARAAALGGARNVD